MRTVIILIFIFLSSTIFAQTDFRKGKIIKLNGDTVIGELDFQGDVANSKAIRFRNQEIDSTFKPFDINSYFFDNGKHYISKYAIITTDTLRIFAEYLVSGVKDLYFSRSGAGFSYLINKSDSVIVAMPHIIENVNIDGVNYEKESKLFVGYLKSYFNDCPSLYATVDNLQTPDRKSLIKLTKQYHDITCGEGSCVVYEREEYQIKIAIEPNYSYTLTKPFATDAPFNTFGGNIYFWIPNSSERLFIKSGLYFTQFQSTNYYQIPLQFEYVIPFKFVKPKFNIGVNTHIFEDGDKGLTALAGGGCYIKLTNWVYLDIDLSSDLFAFQHYSPFILTLTSRTGLYFIINNKKYR